MSARDRVNPTGRCCTIKMGIEEMAVSAGSKSASARGPPVEAPIRMASKLRLSVEIALLFAETAGRLIDAGGGIFRGR